MKTKIPTSLKIRLQTNDRKIVQAISNKFADVPSKNFAKGAMLINRKRFYQNVGDDKVAKWRKISGEIRNR